VAAGYEVDPGEVEPDVRHFIDQLVADGLVTATDGAEGTDAMLTAAGPYLAPAVERYDKLDDLMLSGE
jgi:hypothetical protein